MAATTILADTKTGVSTYTSGSLDVGGVTELLLDFHVTASTGGTPTVHEDWNPVTDAYDLSFVLSRLDAFGNAFELSRGTLSSMYSQGEPAVYPAGFLSFLLSSGFGSHIRVDLDNPDALEATFTISIIGK